MKLDELKETWQLYDKKLTSTMLINEKIIKSIIREKSTSTLAKMRRNCLLAILWMSVVIWFCVMSIIYNAFDYQYNIQFLPLVIFVAVGLIFVIYLVKEYFNTKVDLYNNNIKTSLLQVLAFHEKLYSTNKIVPVLFLLGGFLYLFSSAIKAFHHEGIVHALIFLLGAILLNGALFFIAHRMGAFKDHFGLKLKNQLKELEEFEEDGINF